MTDNMDDPEEQIAEMAEATRRVWAAALGVEDAQTEKGRRYVDSPEEAPDDVEVQEGPQGGLYYETDGTTGEPGQTMDVESRVQEATGATTDLSGFDPEESKRVGKALTQAADRGWTDRVEVIASAPPDFLDEQEREKAERAFGFYDENYKTLYFNPEKVNEEETRDAESQWLLTDGSIEGVINHELGHARHYDEMDGASLPDDWEPIADRLPEIEDADMLKYIAFARPDDIHGEPDGISKLAQVSPMEFVAETHAALAAGQEVDEGVLKLYQELDGPEVHEPMERSEKSRETVSKDEFPEWIQAEVELMEMLNR